MSQVHPGGHRHPGGGPAKLLDETGDDGDHLLFERILAYGGDSRGGHTAGLVQGWCRSQYTLGGSSKSDTAGQRWPAVSTLGRRRRRLRHPRPSISVPRRAKPVTLLCSCMAFAMHEN
jgi:hypothetical protein